MYGIADIKFVLLWPLRAIFVLTEDTQQPMKAVAIVASKEDNTADVSGFW